MSNEFAFSSEDELQSTVVLEGIDGVTYRLEVYRRLTVDLHKKIFVCKAYELTSFPSLDAPGTFPAMGTQMWKLLILPTVQYKEDVFAAMEQAKDFLAAEIRQRHIATETSED